MIEAVIDRVIERLSPARGDNLLGFRIGLDHFMAAGDSFRDIDFEAGEPRSLINAKAELADEVASLQEISDALGTMWRAVAYLHFQASTCLWYREATVFRFVTVPTNDDYFVTGTITITGPHYPRPVERFEHDFARTFGRLPSLR